MKITKLPKVKVLVCGIHEMYENERLRVGATSTLIKSKNINIVVDPGSFVNRDRLVTALKNEGLDVVDIQAVILTHSHIDHTSNSFLFSQAKIYCKFNGGNYKGQFQNIKEGFVERFDILNQPIAEGVKIIDTIGHSVDHISVVVDTDLGRVVVAGDAIAKEIWADTSKLPEAEFVYRVEEYAKSRKKILEIADFIVPGHGAMFKVNK